METAEKTAEGPQPGRRIMHGRLKKVLVNGAVLLCAAMVVFALIEIGIRIFAPQPRYYLPQNLFSADSSLGYVLTPGFRGSMYTPESSSAIAINEEGFRGGMPDGVKRLIVGMGDSFTFGTGVEIEDTYLEKLRGQLNEHGSRVDLYNLGVPGYGTDQEYGALKKLYEKRTPDLVLVGFYINDVMDSVTPDFTVVDGYTVPSNKMMAAFKGKGLSWKQRISKLFDKLDTPRFVVNRMSASPHFRKLFLDLTVRSKGKEGNRLAYYSSASTPALEEAWSVTKGHLRSIRDLVRAHGGKLLVIYIPERQQVYADQWRKVLLQQEADEKSYDRDKPQQTLKNFCREAKIPYLDLTDEFRKRVEGGEDIYFTMDPHLNAKGNSLAANLISRIILDEGLLSR